MSSTVQLGSMEITSTSSSAKEMVESLTPEPEKIVPKVIRDKGKEVEPEELEGLSKAASELGKEGGKAAAKARKAADKEAKEEPEEKPEPKEEKAEPKEEEPKEEAQPEPKKKPHPSDDPKARVELATRREAEARTEARHARAQAARLEQELQELRSRVDKVAPAETKPNGQDHTVTQDPKPRVEDFEDWQKYEDARDEWLTRQVEAKYEAKLAEREADQQEAQAVQTLVRYYRGKLAEAEKAEPGIRDRIDDRLLDKLRPSWDMLPNEKYGPQHALADGIMTAQRPAHVLAYLSEHPEEFQRLVALRTPQAISLAIARLDGRLEAATSGTSAKPEVSQAKPPVKPVHGSPHTDSGELDDKAPLSAFVRKSQERLSRSSR